MFYGIYDAILSLYCNDYYSSPDEIIAFSSAPTNPKQLLLSSYDKNSIQNINVPGLILYLNRKPYQFNTITELINSTIINIPDYKTIEYSTLASKVLYKWFSIKAENNSNGNGNLIEGRPEVPFEKLQKFIDIYWRMFHQLIDEKILLCKKPRLDPPKIFSSDMPFNKLGNYNRIRHELKMNMDHYSVEIFNREISKFTKLDSSNITEFNMNSTLIKYFSPCKPANTLLHEIGHAFNSSDHSGSFHDVTDVKFVGGNNLPYDDMCLMIFQCCVERGLMIEYIDSLNK